MTRRLRVEVAGSSPDARPIRILALSDEPDRALDDVRNRDALGRIDLVVGCGDLRPDRLCPAFDSFDAPCIYVRGNHDTGAAWSAGARDLPEEPPSGLPLRRAGLRLVPLAWPHPYGDAARRDEWLAWRHVVSARLRRAGGREPLVVFSHAAPLDVGDGADDYHRGFRGYLWLLDSARPALWLHGHPPFAGDAWWTKRGATTVVNVTGSVLIELFV